MTNTKLTTKTPTRGVEYDPAKPETRDAWLAQRRTGVTATNVRDAGDPSDRRKIVNEKVTGEFEDLSGVPHVRHGVLREPQIADWIHRKFGITPCNSVYAGAENSRHLASPDGISLDPFDKTLVVGAPDAKLAEIKASKHDLTPGRLDEDRVLLEIESGSAFDRSNYYTQVQWQMYVMNASVTLFAWEQRSDRIDEATGTYEILGTPQYAWIPRDQKLIDHLVNKVAASLLDDIDAAVAAAASDDDSDAEEPTLPDEHLELVKKYIAGRRAEAEANALVAEAVKEKDEALKALKAFYVNTGQEDISLDLDGATFRLQTSEKTVNVFDSEAAARRAPQLVERYQALVKRYTKPQVKSNQTLTITPTKEK